MWESLKDIFVSDNFGNVIIGISALIILLAYLVKKGIFSFRGKGLTVGISNEEELSIVRKQIEFCSADANNMLRDIMKIVPENTEINIYKAKYTIERVFDEMVKIVALNNITTDSTYIMLKQELIWSIVSNINPEPCWNNLESLVKERVANAIKTLYEIRHNSK